MIHELELSNGIVALVDEQDWDSLSARKWHAIRTRKEGGKIYVRSSSADRNIYMHREIMRPQQGQEVDHRDGNGLNNTRDNLRLCTRSQNCANTRKPTSISGLIGVQRCSRDRKWRAFISEEGKKKWLGNFSEAIDAARVRDAYAFAKFGDFAVLNFPREGAE